MEQPKWNEAELLSAIRERPGMYLGKKSLTAFRHYCEGYNLALLNYGISDSKHLGPSREMHDWVAYKLGYRESTSGYANMILEYHSLEDEALDVFFDLLDEYENRVPHTFAIIENIDAQYRTIQGGKETWHRYPDCIDLVTYGDYRGFFAVAADEEQYFPGQGFHPFLSWLETFSRFKREKFTIVDEELYFKISQVED